MRAAAAQQLPALARRLEAAPARRRQLLAELAQLLEDEEPRARSEALAALAGVAEALQQALPRCSMQTAPRGSVTGAAAAAAAVSSSSIGLAALLPLARAQMQPLGLDAAVQRRLAALFPALLGALRGCLGPGDAALFYSCFRHLAARPDAELRLACAGALPALMRAPLPGMHAAYFHDTWADLVADGDARVRASAAAAAAQVARAAPPAEAARLLRRPLAAALGDECGAVRRAALACLPAALAALAGAEEAQRDALGAEVHSALLRLRGGLGCDWRAQLLLLRALPALPFVVPGDAVAEAWAPAALAWLTAGAARAKPAAAAALAALLRACRRERGRTDLLCRIVRELARGRGCWARLGFVEFAAAALRRFSARFFKVRRFGARTSWHAAC